jgi:molecular chaperone GrpE
MKKLGQRRSQSVTDERPQQVDDRIEEQDTQAKAGQEKGPAEATGDEQPEESLPPAEKGEGAEAIDEAEALLEELEQVGSEAGEEAETVDEVAVLRQELEQVKAKEAEYLDGWQRARAELSNARKRFQRDQIQAYANAKADLLVRLLPIVDDFERAFETLPEDLSPADPAPASLNWLEGMQLVWRKLQLLLEQEGVVPIEAVGEAFDPFLHQAVTHEPSAEVPEGHIIAEMQRGYMVGDRVLRPSAVRVSSGPVPEPEPTPEAATIEPESPSDEGTEK